MKITLTIPAAKLRLRFAPPSIRYTDKKKQIKKNACRTKHN